MGCSICVACVPQVRLVSPALGSHWKNFGCGVDAKSFCAAVEGPCSYAVMNGGVGGIGLGSILGYGYGRLK